MKKETAVQLIALNNEFYQTFAGHFSATRMRLQPGVMKILEDQPMNARILDLGCGNGELARELIRRNFHGEYIGVDFSDELLEVAREGVSGFDNFTFIPGDLGSSEWYSSLTLHYSSFPIIFAFAAIHHIPSHELHIHIFNTIHKLLSHGGMFIQSNWQVLNSEKLRTRIQSWSEIGLSKEAVDPGDYLLDWRQGGRRLRYVHHFDDDELKKLANDTGFEVIDSFFSDGEGGNLGLYQIWKILD